MTFKKIHDASQKYGTVLFVELTVAVSSLTLKSFPFPISQNNLSIVDLFQWIFII